MTRSIQGLCRFLSPGGGQCLLTQEPLHSAHGLNILHHLREDLELLRTRQGLCSHRPGTQALGYTAGAGRWGREGRGAEKSWGLKSPPRTAPALPSPGPPSHPAMGRGPSISRVSSSAWLRGSTQKLCVPRTADECTSPPLALQP